MSQLFIVKKFWKSFGRVQAAQEFQMTTTHDTHLLLWICKLHQSVHWRYREDPTESFQSCSTVMCEFVYKERSSSSFKYSAREKIDWCRKVIRSHLQSNSCWHHIFLLLSSGSSLHKFCITVLYFWVFGLSESIQLATLKLKAQEYSQDWKWSWDHW
jgi:hypothetical protein